MKTDPFILRSRHDVTQCVAKLRESPEVVGTIETTHLCLRRKVPYSSLFQPTLIATLAADRSGTRIEGNVQFNGGGEIVFRIISIACAFVAAVILIVTVIRLVRGEGQQDAWMGLFIPLAVGLGVWAYRAVMRRYLVSETDYLSRYLSSVLETSPAS